MSPGPVPGSLPPVLGVEVVAGVLAADEELEGVGLVGALTLGVLLLVALELPVWLFVEPLLGVLLATGEDVEVLVEVVVNGVLLALGRILR